jgi:hypothetical protein
LALFDHVPLAKGSGEAEAWRNVRRKIFPGIILLSTSWTRTVAVSYGEASLPWGKGSDEAEGGELCAEKFFQE